MLHKSVTSDEREKQEDFHEELCMQCTYTKIMKRTRCIKFNLG